VRLYIAHSLAGFDFHDHRPAVRMHQHLLRDLDERILWHFNSTSGSSRIASSASFCITPRRTSTGAFPLQGLHPSLSLGVAALISATGLHRGIVRPLSLAHTAKPTPFRTLPRTADLTCCCLASGLSSTRRAGGPPNQVVLPLFSSASRRP
jgi:hypothetical protein